MDHTAEKPAHAPYGTACLNCVKSKTRCAGNVDAEKCERCRRLNKNCQPAPTTRKQRVSKRPAATISVNKTAALEEKIDGILEMLQRSQATLGQTRPVPNTEDTAVPGSPAHVRDLSNVVSLNNLIAILNVDQTTRMTQGPPTPAASATSNPPDHIFSCVDGPPPASFAHSKYALETEAELEEYLHTYRTKMVLYCPIVPIEATATVKSMSEEHPFLWLVIRAVCSKRLTRQRALELEARQILGKEMLINGTRSMDLLMGVLVFAAWGHYFCTSKPITQPIIMLAMSLAYDRGLTKPIPTDSLTVMLNFNSQGCPKPVLAGQSLVRTMEERRTVIGLFLISSIYANYFGRMEPLNWTPYLEECLQLLEEHMEIATDNILIQLVRIQLICNKLGAVIWKTSPVPHSVYVKSFASELESLERSIPPALKLNETLQLATLHTKIALHEHSLDACPPSTTLLERIDSLWSCLLATKSWFTLFFRLDVIPLFSYPQVSMSVFSQMAHCMIVLFRLSTFESPGVPWDLKRVREELDMGETMKLMANRWGEVAAIAELHEGRIEDIQGSTHDFDSSPWACMKKKLLLVAHFWEMKLSSMRQSEERRPKTVDDSDFAFGGADQQLFEQIDFANMDFLSDMWMGEYSGFDLSRPYA